MNISTRSRSLSISREIRNSWATLPHLNILAFRQKKTHPSVCLFADVAKITVPENREAIDKKHSVVEGNEREVDDLYKGPDHPVALQGSGICLG